MITRLALVLLMTGFALPAVAAADEPGDKELIAQAAAERRAAAPAPASGDVDLGAVEEVAAADAAIAQARLELVRARRALKVNNAADAQARANAALQQLAKVPAKVDVSALQLQAEGILARVGRAPRGAARPAPALSTQDPAAPRVQPAEHIGDALDTQVRAAQQIVGGYDGAPTPDVNTHIPAADLRERTLRDGDPKGGYHPGSEVIDNQSIDERDRQLPYYQGALRGAVTYDETRRLVGVDEARLAGEDDVAYPADWAERIARRSQWKDGVIVQSAPVADKDGKQWYTAVYDITDLTYVPPDFQIDPVFLNPYDGMQNALDRDAMRNSWGYNGFPFGFGPADMAGIAYSLRLFGGGDPFTLRGPKYSAEKQREVVELIRSYTQMRNFEPVIESFGPTNP